MDENYFSSSDPRQEAGGSTYYQPDFILITRDELQHSGVGPTDLKGAITLDPCREREISITPSDLCITDCEYEPLVSKSAL